VILLDSDHASVLAESRSRLRSQLVSRIEQAAEPIALPIAVAEEQLRGWLAEIHRERDANRQIVPYLRLSKMILFLAGMPLVDWNEPAADHFHALRARRIRVGTQDLKIASIALAHDALLLSANLVDFERVPGLRVQDWLYGSSQ
jgi:tRNA(fMet)-specific endonuclease VapC